MAQKAQQLEQAAKQARDAFRIYENPRGSKTCDACKVPDMVRAMGLNPSSEQLAALQERLAAPPPTRRSGSGNGTVGTAPGEVTIDRFEAVASTFVHEYRKELARDDFHTLMRAFRALDPEGRGYLDAAQLRAALCSSGGAGDAGGAGGGVEGERLTVQELEAMLEAAGVGAAGEGGGNAGKLRIEEYAYRLAMDGRVL